MYTPPTHTFNSSQIFPLCLSLTTPVLHFFNPLRSICAAHIHMGVDPPTGTRATYGATPKKIDPLPQEPSIDPNLVQVLWMFFAKSFQACDSWQSKYHKGLWPHEFSDSFIFMPETGEPVFAYKVRILNQYHWKEWASWIPAPHHSGFITYSLPGTFL